MADNPPSWPIIALDTNALVQSIPTRGRFRPIIEGFDAGHFVLVVSNEILLEYEEILKAIGGPMAWSSFDSLLMARAAFVRRVDPTYYWEAIMHDSDDNKYVDAAVAGEADWIVTEDSHYDVLFEDMRLTVRPLHPSLFIDRFLQVKGG
jgi:predicted nucleic acid-binding protein